MRPVSLSGLSLRRCYRSLEGDGRESSHRHSRSDDASTRSALGGARTSALSASGESCGSGAGAVLSGARSIPGGSGVAAPQLDLASPRPCFLSAQWPPKSTAFHVEAPVCGSHSHSPTSVQGRPRGLRKAEPGDPSPPS
eukprot:COSAG04_NODE_148_length_22826_cov_11.360026_9_plen_139_part_00